jgi:hypothetical protein
VYPRLCGRLALAGACVVVVGVPALEAQNRRQKGVGTRNLLGTERWGATEQATSRARGWFHSGNALPC